MLKCSCCGLTTDHNIAGIRDGNGLKAARDEDWREERNAKEQSQLRQILFLESVYEQFGVQLRYVDQLLNVRDMRCTFGVSLYRIYDDGDVWVVQISMECTSDGRLDALQQALGLITKTDQFQTVEPGDSRCLVWAPPRSGYLQDEE